MVFQVALSGEWGDGFRHQHGYRSRWFFRISTAFAGNLTAEYLFLVLDSFQKTRRLWVVQMTIVRQNYSASIAFEDFLKLVSHSSAWLLYHSL